MRPAALTAEFKAREAKAHAAGHAKSMKEIVAWLEMWSQDLFMDEDNESFYMSKTLREAADKIKRGEHLMDLKARKKAKS